MGCTSLGASRTVSGRGCSTTGAAFFWAAGVRRRRALPLSHACSNSAPAEARHALVTPYSLDLAQSVAFRRACSCWGLGRTSADA